MTEEQIKRKAKTYSTNYWYNTNNSVNVESIEKLLIDFATEATKELQEATKKFKSDYHELCNLQDMRIAELEKQVEKMKRCEICKHYRWNHCSYEINISEDCIQNKLKHFELKE